MDNLGIKQVDTYVHGLQDQPGSRKCVSVSEVGTYIANWSLGAGLPGLLGP